MVIEPSTRSARPRAGENARENARRGDRGVGSNVRAAVVSRRARGVDARAAARDGRERG